MLHVFVETNWVIDFVAPFQVDPWARDLLDLATEGRLQLHIPGICLNEAKNKITQLKSLARSKADGVRAFLKSRPTNVSSEDAQVVFQVLDNYETSSAAKIGKFEQHLRALFTNPGVDVFALDDDMLEKALELTGGDFAELKPFDQAILAGILVRAEGLKGSGQLVFCEKDSDLQDYNKDGKPKPWLAEVYRRAGLTVRRNFDVSEFLDGNQ